MINSDWFEYTLLKIMFESRFIISTTVLIRDSVHQYHIIPYCTDRFILIRVLMACHVICIESYQTATHIERRKRGRYPPAWSTSVCWNADTRPTTGCQDPRQPRRHLDASDDAAYVKAAHPNNRNRACKRSWSSQAVVYLHSWDGHPHPRALRASLCMCREGAHPNNRNRTVCFSILFTSKINGENEIWS